MYQFYLPTRVIFGRNAINTLAKNVKHLGKTSLIVCGKQSIKESGLLKRVVEMLNSENIKTTVFDRVFSEPDTKIVEEGISVARENDCNLIIGIGGGSVLDTAKAISGLTKIKNISSVSDYLEIDGTKNLSEEISAVGTACFVAVPTISGSGAEVTMNAVLINSKTGKKRSLRNPCLFAGLALVDPELTLTLPADITAIAGIDALCHLIEGYISKESNIVCDALSNRGMELVLNSLPELIKDRNNISARTDIALASLYGGIMIANSGLTLAHGLGSVIGPKFSIPHGLACGIVLPGVLEYNLSHSKGNIPEDKIAILKELFGKNPATKIQQFMSGVNLPTRLTGLENFHHLTGNDLKEIAEESLNTGSAKKNPVQVNPETVIEIIKTYI